MLFNICTYRDRRVAKIRLTLARRFAPEAKNGAALLVFRRSSIRALDGIARRFCLLFPKQITHLYLAANSIPKISEQLEIS